MSIAETSRLVCLSLATRTKKKLLFLRDDGVALVTDSDGLAETGFEEGEPLGRARSTIDTATSTAMVLCLKVTSVNK